MRAVTGCGSDRQEQKGRTKGGDGGEGGARKTRGEGDGRNQEGQEERGKGGQALSGFAAERGLIWGLQLKRNVVVYQHRNEFCN